MTEFGKTLREAREAKGLAIAQIAEQTHLLPQIVEDLEHEDFHRISAPIYGRGFVKLYCETVGLDPKPLVDEFMAILNGEREPAIKLREVELPPDEPAAPAEPPPPPAPPVYTQPELGDEAPGEVAGQETRETPVAPQVGRETRDASLGLRPETAAPPPEPRQYHPDYARSSSTIPFGPNFGRLAILAGGALAIIALLVWGGRALYRASMGEPSEPAAGAEATEEPPAGAPEADTDRKPADAKAKSGKTAVKKAEPAKAETKKSDAKKADSEKADAKKADAKKADAKKPAVKRQPKDVPPLYID